MHRPALPHALLLLALPVVCPLGLVHADGQIHKDATSLRASLPNGVELSFALRDGHLLGLQSARVGGLDLKHPDTLVRPFIFTEWTEPPRVVEYLKFDNARFHDGSFHIEISLHASTGHDALRQWLVYRPSEQAALELWPTDQTSVRDLGQAAINTIQQTIAQHSATLELNARIDELRQKLRSAKADQRSELNQQLRELQQKATSLPGELRTSLAAADPDFATLLARQAAYEKLLAQLAVTHSRPHLDYYSFHHIRLPAEIATTAYQTARLAHAGDAAPVGKLTWVFTPVEVNIAG